MSRAKPTIRELLAAARDAAAAESRKRSEPLPYSSGYLNERALAWSSLVVSIDEALIALHEAELG